jgi:hypothetical protein
VKFILFIITIALSSVVFSAGEMPVTFNLAGRLYDSPTSSDPLLAQDVELKIQILDAAKACILYEEIQVVDTDTSDGHFAILVGSSHPSAKRGPMDAQNSMATIFQNTTDIPARGCAGNLSPKVAKSGRYLRMTVTPSGGAPDTLSPDIFIGNVPMALVAETLGGLTKDQFLQLKDPSTSELTQANLENIFSSTNYPILADLMQGTLPTPSLSSENDFSIVADSASPGSGAIKFTIGSSVKAKVTNAGDFVAHNKIGVGVDAPTYDLSFGGSADRILGIERRTTVGVAGNTLSVIAGGASVNGTNLLGGSLILSSGISTGNQTSGIYFKTASAGASGTGDNTPTTKMTLDGAGQLGLGTLSPGRMVHVVSSTSPTIVLENTTADPDSRKRYITTSVTGDMAFGKLTDDMASSTENMRIFNNGNVRIGNTTNAVKLTITDGTTPDTPSIIVPHISVQANAPTYYHAKDKSNAIEFLFGTSSLGHAFAGAVTNHGFALRTNNQNRLYISAAGDVGVGTITPVSKLHVGVAPTATPKFGLLSLGDGPFNGTTAGYFKGHASGTYFATNASSAYDGDLVNLQVAGDSKFKIDKDGVITSGGSFTTTGNFTQTGSATFSTGTGNVSLNGPTTIAADQNLTMASGTGVIAQTYTGTSSAATIAADNLTSGSILHLTSSTTTAAAGNAGIKVEISGANASSGITRTGISSTVTATGTTSTNVAGYFSASGGTNNYAIIVPAGRVGIGTSTPSASLDVGGGDITTGFWYRQSGIPILSRVNSNTLLTAKSGEGVAFGVNGAISATSASMIVKSNGNVGIGTTSPVTNLDLQGTFRVHGGPSALTSLASALNPGDATITVGSTANYPSSGVLYIHSTTAPYTSEVVSYTGKTSTTFTGLTRGLYGTTETTLDAGLTVDTCLTCIAADSTSAPSLFITKESGIGIGAVPPSPTGSNGLHFGSAILSGSIGWGDGTGASITGTGSSGTGYLSFKLGAAERLRIASAGVGISTSSPATLLSNTNTSIVDASNKSVMTQGFTWANNAAGYAFGIYNRATNDSHGLLVKGAGSAITNVLFAVDQGTIQGGQGTSLFRVHGNGNVGIGVLSAASKLQVDGVITPGQTATHDLGTTALRWNNIYLSNAPDVSSDIRLKKDVKDSELGLEFINLLRPVSWTWKDENSGSERHYGIIAQETKKALAKVRPESSSENAIVNYNPDSDSFSVRYTELISPLIKAVQELYQEFMGVKGSVKKHEERIAELESENAQLKERLEKIEALLSTKNP